MPNYGYTHNELRNNPEYQRLKQELGEAQELMNAYNCALLEVKSKLDILNEYFSLYGEQNPINDIQTRLKKPDSIYEKLKRYNLPVTLDRQKALVIGWGRIGKCLAQLLKSIGAQVTVAARKESDRVMLKALGYSALDTCNLDTTPYSLIFNTVPQMICPDCPGKGLKIDLASKLGLGGEDVIWARGLPGKDAPESSGELIFQTACHFIYGKEYL